MPVPSNDTLDSFRRFFKVWKYQLYYQFLVMSSSWLVIFCYRYCTDSVRYSMVPTLACRATALAWHSGPHWPQLLRNLNREQLTVIEIYINNYYKLHINIINYVICDER